MITRPRRFGKTLNMSMLEYFFSIEHAEREDLFDKLIWNEEKYRELQGTYPVIFISFADVKETSYIEMKAKISLIITDLYNQYDFLRKADCLPDKGKDLFDNISYEMPDSVISYSIKVLSKCLHAYYGKKVIFFWMNI